MQQHINHQSWLHDTWSHTQGCSSDAKKGQQQYSRPRLVHCTSTHKCQTATLSIHTVTVCACDLDKQQWHGPGAVNMGPYHLSTTLGLYTHNNVMQYTVTASTEGLLRVIYSSCINYDLSTNQSINQSITPKIGCCMAYIQPETKYTTFQTNTINNTQPMTHTTVSTVFHSLQLILIYTVSQKKVPTFKLCNFVKS